MRHGDALNRLGRHASERKALVRNLLTSLVLKERVETTLARARVLKGWADQIVTLGKRADLHARRTARRYLYTDAAVGRLFAYLAPRFAGRQGGYTRLFRIGFRRGDATEMALLEYLPPPSAAEKKGRGKPKAGKDKGSKEKAK